MDPTIEKANTPSSSYQQDISQSSVFLSEADKKITEIFQNVTSLDEINRDFKDEKNFLTIFRII